jgi:cysteine synthase A
MKTINNILSIIGNTPLYKFNKGIYAKAEFLNPGGSIKDRIAIAMIESAERDGILHSESIIVEPTSGNTGIGLSLVGSLKGYAVQIVMPENMSMERRMLIQALGGTVVLTPAEENLSGAIVHARAIQARDSRVFMPNQFENRANPEVHYKTTAKEIWNQMEGDIACFVSGIGSGGTIQGIGSFLKEQDADIRIVAAEPKNSSAILGHEPGLHQIQGIGDGFIPDILDLSLIDEVIEVTDKDAIDTTKRLSSEYGLLVGISSGANFWVAKQIVNNINGNVVTILPDRAERYFSTALMDYQHGGLSTTSRQESYSQTESSAL